MSEAALAGAFVVADDVFLLGRIKEERCVPGTTTRAAIRLLFAILGAAVVREPARAGLLAPNMPPFVIASLPLERPAAGGLVGAAGVSAEAQRMGPQGAPRGHQAGTTTAHGRRSRGRSTMDMRSGATHLRPNPELAAPPLQGYLDQRTSGCTQRRCAG